MFVVIVFASIQKSKLHILEKYPLLYQHETPYTFKSKTSGISVSFMVNFTKKRRRRFQIITYRTQHVHGPELQIGKERLPTTGYQRSKFEGLKVIK